LYAIEAEIRFGAKARSSSAGAWDRRSTTALKLAATIPMLGFVLAMKGARWSGTVALPSWLVDPASIPGMPVAAWIGVALAACGVLVRLWALLTLRHRYTRTLLVGDDHPFERGGPYRFVRHPGYLGSLLFLDGLALSSGNAVTLAASVVVTFAAYAYRIRSEDAMLVAAFGEEYVAYRREVPALIPFIG
jgi:protein-S-isoprenylcysteine O-methyltransferase Ste14